MEIDVEGFSRILKGRHDYARSWKQRTGGKVLGYLCTYVPEELIYAAGALPVRVMGGHEPQDVTEPHIAGYYCAWCRDCLAQGLLGKYDYLDGLVAAHTCMHIRQTFNSWTRHIPLPYSYYLFMPGHVKAPAALECLRKELAAFKASLESWTGRTIGEDDLDRAVRVYNRHRRLLRRLYEDRKSGAPYRSSWVLEVVLSGMVMDKEEHSSLLERTLDRVQWSGEGAGVPVLLFGSVVDSPEFLDFLESLGARVVIDDLCTGSRYFWNEVPEDASGLTSLALRYLEKPPCPMKDLVERRRPEYIVGLAREYGARGAIFIQQKFCDPHGADFPSIKSALEAAEIPVLRLETDVTTPVGQFRTRVEAFLEMLQTELIT